MKFILIVVILFPLIYGQNNTNTTVDTRTFGVLTRTPLDWIQQALNTASNAFTLGVETGKQWFNFGLNTANQWVTAIHNPPNSTSSSIIPSEEERAIQREIAQLRKDLGNKGTWFRSVKEKRLNLLIDKLNSLHDNSENNINNLIAPLDVTKYNFTITTAPNSKPVQSFNKTTDDSIISVIN